MANPVEGRVILEVTRQHAILYLCDEKGIVVDNDVFRHPFRVDKQDAFLQCKDVFDLIYDALNRAVNADSARGSGDKPKSG